jgi:hypothetical protein
MEMSADIGGPMPCLLFIAIAILVIVGIVYAFMKARQRREAMARLAAELDLKFYAADPWDLPVRYGHMDLFQTGHSRRASNVLAGQVDGRDVVAFDYQYTTGSGKNSHTYYCQAAVFEMPIVAPRLWLRRENIFDKIASWVGHDDLNFESAEFSGRYHVKCQVPKFAYDIFHNRLIEYLLACGNAPAMEMNGPLLLLYESGSGGPDHVRRLIEIGREMMRSIPDYVRRERGIGANRGGGP